MRYVAILVVRRDNWMYAPRQAKVGPIRDIIYEFHC